MTATILVILLTCGIVLASVSVHYEALHLLTRLQRRKERWYSNRLRAGLLVLGCLVAHALEVVLFGAGYWIVESANQSAGLRGDVPDGFNCMYYSTVVYTSIGFGDVVPVNRAVRMMTAIEGLTGAILVAWTASFMFFHMQRFWRTREECDTD